MISKQRRLSRAQTSVTRKAGDLGDLSDCASWDEEVLLKRLERVQDVLRESLVDSALLDQVHGFLLMSLGKCLWKLKSHDQVHTPLATTSKLTSLLCETMEILYERKLDSLSSKGTTEACGIVLELVDIANGDKAICMRLLRMLLPTARIEHVAIGGPRKLCLALVSAIQLQPTDMKPIVKSCLEELQTSIDRQTVCYASHALLVLASKDWCVTNSLKNASSSLRDTDVFCLHCSSLCHKNPFDKETIQQLWLVVMGENVPLACEAAACVSRSTLLLRSLDEAQALFRALLETNQQVKHQLLVGLSTNWSFYENFLPKDVELTKRLISTLVNAILTSSDCHATTVRACRLLMAVMKKAHGVAPSELWAIGLVLLEHESSTVVRLAADYLCEELSPDSVAVCPEILSGLATLILIQENPETCRQIAKAWQTLTQNEPHGLACSTLARQPKVLEAIVEMSRSEDSEIMETSVEIVLNLSVSVLNRRLLARQSGLLASLIRYTRRYGDEDSQRRKDIKETILAIAAAL